MIRIFLIALATYALANVDLSSSAALESSLYPTIALVYIFFLLFDIIIFFRARGIRLNKTIEHDGAAIVSNILDLVIAIFEDRTEKYHGQFSFLGPLAGLVEDVCGYLELACSLYALYNVFMLIGGALSS